MCISARHTSIVVAIKKKTMVIKLMPSISWELVTKNHDVLIVMKNLEDLASMIGLHIEKKLRPNMPT